MNPPAPSNFVPGALDSGDGKPAAPAAPPNWFTCTPVRFAGGDAFFARDSGLLCKGFQSIGVPCRAIMPGPSMPDDHDGNDLIRTDDRNLEDPAWWRALGADGVVLYSWAAPRYAKVASAIREAGAFLVINTDTAGILSVWTDGLRYLGFRHRYLRFLHGEPRATLHFAAVALRDALPWTVDLPRLRHMACADHVGAVTPLASQRIARYARFFGFPQVASRITLIHHPVADYFDWHGVPKEKSVVAVGRWTRNDAVKRPALLLAIAERFLTMRTDHRFEIIGPFDAWVENAHRGLPGAIRKRVILHGRLPNRDSRTIVERARIALCTSANESFHIASAEAVCAGCSVVGLKSPFIAFLSYLADENCATLARKDTLDSFVDALDTEARAWDAGERDPARISGMWKPRLHAPATAARILKLAADGKAADPAPRP